MVSNKKYEVIAVKRNEFSLLTKKKRNEFFHRKMTFLQMSEEKR
jgi:hypothetical protein